MPSCEPIRRYGRACGLVGEGGVQRQRLDESRITTLRDRVSIAKTLCVAPNRGLGKCWAGVTVCIVEGLEYPGNLDDGPTRGGRDGWLFVCCLGAVAVSMLLCCLGWRLAVVCCLLEIPSSHEFSKTVTAGMQ